MSRSRVLPAALALGGALALVSSAGGAGHATAQEPSERPRPEPSAGPVQSDTVADPPMASSPRAFRVGVGLGLVTWSDEPERAALEEALTAGVEVESRVLAWLGFRVGVAYGRTEAVQPGRRTGVAQYAVDLAAALHPPPSMLGGWPVAPFLATGVASVVQDPAADGLSTRSQGAFTYGGGVEWDPPGRFGGRAEWRRYSVAAQDLFDPVDRTSTRRAAHRFAVSALWKL